MIFSIHVFELINDGKILFKIELFGKLLIQSIGPKVTISFHLLVKLICFRSMEFKYSFRRNNDG
jgi:hypothetical protein